jgi:hypothetical protein
MWPDDDDTPEPAAWINFNAATSERNVSFVCESELASIPLWPEPSQRKPLTDEELETAYREIWRNLPEDFNYGAYGWIEQGIRYAEKAHGIGGHDD